MNDSLLEKMHARFVQQSVRNVWAKFTRLKSVCVCVCVCVCACVCVCVSVRVLKHLHEQCCICRCISESWIRSVCIHCTATMLVHACRHGGLCAYTKNMKLIGCHVCIEVFVSTEGTGILRSAYTCISPCNVI